MKRDGRSSSHDPTAERMVDQSSQSAGGLTTRGPADVDSPSRGPDDDIVNRRGADGTPRRYEQPLEADDDPAAKTPGS